MDYVIGVSWPRSGHHMLVRLLQAYFGDAFSYCAFYGGREDCCRQVPCARAGEIHFSKNHDFDLTVPQIRGRKYLIQYRTFLPSAISNFELAVRKGRADTPASFRDFASHTFSAYRAFVAKWIESDFGRGQLVLEYDGLLADPAAALGRAIRLFAPADPVDPARIGAAVGAIDGEKIELGKVHRLRQSGVHAARDIEAFRHFEPELFRQLGQLRLSRDEVNGVFLKHLSRKASPNNMVALQTFANVEALEASVLASPEYQSRH